MTLLFDIIGPAVQQADIPPSQSVRMCLYHIARKLLFIFPCHWG